MSKQELKEMSDQEWAQQIAILENIREMEKNKPVQK
jgi:hypothetical protein